MITEDYFVLYLKHEDLYIYVSVLGGMYESEKNPHSCILN